MARVEAVTSWWPAFLLTIAIETPIYALVLRRRVGLRRAVAASLLLNAATHPLAWHVYGLRPSPAGYVIGEALVWLAEAVLLYGASRHRALLPARRM